MKNAITLVLIFVTFLSTAQQKKITKTGKITFEASVPAFEEVKARTETATCILNTETGEIATLALIKSFRFKIALMEEHFNENYIESSKYPKATFKGTIADFNYAEVTATAKSYTINGVLELHGKTKNITINATIQKSGAALEINSSFYINADDFNIAIPVVVKSKVSKKVHVVTQFVLK